MPRVDQDILPTYRDQGFAAVAVNTSKNTEYAAGLALDQGLSLPVAFDLDSETFRFLRIPGFAYPLHVVVGRDGTIAFVDNGPGLAATEAAIVEALAQ